MNKNVNKHLDTLIAHYPDLGKIRENLQSIYIILENLFFNSKTLFVCGNGGSATDAEHIVGELMKSFCLKRQLPAELRTKLDKCYPNDHFSEKLQMGFRTISLQSHMALSTAFANDVDPLMAYAQQLFVLARPEDVVIGISTSGNAVNIMNTFKVARVMGVKTILFTGENCGLCEPYADYLIKAPSLETYRIQEYHLPIYHTLCLMIEERFYGTEQ